MQPHRDSDIKGYVITQTTSPSLGPGNANLKWSDTLKARVYFWKDQVLYHASHLNYYLHKGEERVKTEEQDFIFVHTKGASEGYFYDIFRGLPKKKVKVDSSLQYEWFAQIHIYAIFLTAECRLLSSTEDPATNILQETYSVKGKGEDSLRTATMNLFYSNELPDREFSLSRELDSIKGRRLIKQKVINNPRLMRETNTALPRIEAGFELEKMKNIPDSIARYFEGYKH